MQIGDIKTVWADIFQSGGFWHFNIHRCGEPSAVFESRFKDGHAEQKTAIDHASELMKAFQING